MTDYWDEGAWSMQSARNAVWSELGISDHQWQTRALECLTHIEPALAPVLQPEATIIEIGCGVGRLTIPLALRHPKVEVIGVDSSRGMLARFSEVYRPPNVGTFLTSGCSLPAYAAVDGVFSMVTFQHLEPELLHGYITEVGRRLRHGGIFRFQFVEGYMHVDHDHRYDPLVIRYWLQLAGMIVEDVEHGLMYDEWCWMTARRP